ncbi:S1 family peptidase [Sinorhizobium meliloti]|uniref:S1 family peptidase n=1 Tax=Rhizobium meliloti TaxID=382 RepID=UPI000FDC7C41|nr:serine protease [Sinorhizobium meliloti]RVK40916.1 serine protease [Sinorhizobium meliloti]
MPFPAEPDFIDDRGLFLVQDSALRANILPLFSFDPRSPQERPQGHGTTFRVDPWGWCATAFHVVEDLLEARCQALALRDDVRLVALELPHLVFGSVPLPADCWKPLLGLFSVGGVETPPLARPRVRNMTELAAISIAPSGENFLTVDGRWRPRIGEKVMALGFAELDVDHQEEGADRAMRQYLYGSVGSIIQTTPVQPQSSRPWPTFRVEAEWPGGMSGGPVFNESGNVVGLVSAGLVGERVGTATPFSGWDIPERTFPTVDLINPGRLKCWVGLDSNDDVVAAARRPDHFDMSPSKESVVRTAFVSLDPKSGEYISI